MGIENNINFFLWVLKSLFMGIEIFVYQAALQIIILYFKKFEEIKNNFYKIIKFYK